LLYKEPLLEKSKDLKSILITFRKFVYKEKFKPKGNVWNNSAKERRQNA
jgi:hypothetical protein